MRVSTVVVKPGMRHSLRIRCSDFRGLCCLVATMSSATAAIWLADNGCGFNGPDFSGASNPVVRSLAPSGLLLRRCAIWPRGLLAAVEMPFVLPAFKPRLQVVNAERGERQ